MTWLGIQGPYGYPKGPWTGGCIKVERCWIVWNMTFAFVSSFFEKSIFSFPHFCDGINFLLAVSGL